MLKDKYVFAQLVKFLDNDKFRHLVDKYDGDKYVKSYTCWNQLLTLMFGQLSNRESFAISSWRWKPMQESSIISHWQIRDAE